MSLHTKFTLLTILLGLTVLGGLVLAFWSISVLEREVAAPYRGTTEVLEELRNIKRNLDSQARLAAGRSLFEIRGGLNSELPPAEEALSETNPSIAFRLLAENSRAHVQTLEANAWFQSRAGKAAGRNLAVRLTECNRFGEDWLKSGQSTGELQTLLLSSLLEVHRLIERTEGRLLAEAEYSVAHSLALRRNMTVVVVAALLIAVLMVVLRIVLDRRWVVRPVADLRQAAARLAAGDFDHRIEGQAVAGRDELAMLSREINHTAGMVKALQDERVERERLAAIGQMVQRIAHNLRNPLSGIRGMAELTLEDLPPDSGLRAKQERIMSAVDKFEGWLSQLLNATKPLDVRPRRADPRRWIAGVVETHQAMAAAKGVRLELDSAEAPARATFDPEHLEHAVVAIVTNAIQATPRDSGVVVRVAAVPSAWVIEVSDEGQGVPEEFREQVFRPYFTTKRDGNGIGLAVAQHVIHAHGGTVTAGTAGPEKSGALFRIQLPLRAEETEAIEPAGLERGSGREDHDPAMAGESLRSTTYNHAAHSGH